MLWPVLAIVALVLLYSLTRGVWMVAVGLHSIVALYRAAMPVDEDTAP